MSVFCSLAQVELPLPALVAVELLREGGLDGTADPSGGFVSAEVRPAFGT